MSQTQPPLPGSYEDLLARARSAYQDDNLQDADALYHRLVERLGQLSERLWARRPDLRELYLQAALEYADLLSLEMRFAEAIRLLESLVPSSPEYAVNLRRQVAILRTARGEVERGLSELQALAEEHPGDVWNWIALGNEARQEGRFAESEAALDRGLEAAGRTDAPQLLAEVHYQRFRLFRDMGRVDEALDAWEQAFAAQSGARETIPEVYQFLTDAGWYAEALRYVARDENPLRAGFQRGLVHYRTGKPIEARQEWQAVSEMDPVQFERGQDAWVEAVLRLGDPEPALDRLQELLRQAPLLRLLVLGGIAWAMRGDGQTAAQFFEEAIEIYRRSRRAKTKLDSADWRLLDSLVADVELKSKLKPYFAVVETLWGEPDLDTQVLRP